MKGVCVGFAFLPGGGVGVERGGWGIKIRVEKNIKVPPKQEVPAEAGKVLV